MKKAFLFLAVFTILTLACNISGNTGLTPPPPDATSPLVTAIEVPATPLPATETPTEMPEPTATVLPPSSGGLEVTYFPLSMLVPIGIADGASGMDVPPITGDDSPYWEKTPGHLLVSLGDYYVLQGKSHQPQIYVYPALAYAQLVPGAFESMHRLRNIMSAVVPITADQLPAVPFFNAAQLFASNIQAVSFQNGSGVRFLTEYAQYPAPISNHELFYHFQGFSDDGEYYIVAILPLTVPVLAETSDGGAPLPPGGIPYPYFADPSADMQAYYTAVTTLLNGLSPDAFMPTVGQLDLLIQSIQIIP